jgi:hypothetical protein
VRSKNKVSLVTCISSEWLMMKQDWQLAPSNTCRHVAFDSLFLWQ